MLTETINKQQIKWAKSAAMGELYNVYGMLGLANALKRNGIGYSNEVTRKQYRPHLSVMIDGEPFTLSVSITTPDNGHDVKLNSSIIKLLGDGNHYHCTGIYNRRYERVTLLKYLTLDAIEKNQSEPSKAGALYIPIKFLNPIEHLIHKLKRGDIL